MRGRPVLFVSYSGVLGGAERVLLDCATRLGRPALVACPEGSMGDQYVAGLGNAASYAIANSQLTITLKDGGTLVFK